MTEVIRDAIFLSHANPEDNAFTVWLGSRLAAAGYEAWADVLRLRGGQDWQRQLEDTLRNRACKVLLVGTEHSVQKQGVRNEIQIAHNVGRKISDSEFIIPLRLSDFDAPFLIAHPQYIDFKKNWADGLAELLETLDQTYHVPRNVNSAANTTDYWKQVHLRHARSLTAEPEQLVSNWLLVDRIPELTRIYDFSGGISLEEASRQMHTAPWPIVPFRRGFLAFCPLHDLQDHFGPNLPLQVDDSVDTEHFLNGGCPEQHIRRFDARNLFGDLVRQAMELAFRQRALTSFEMAREQLAWWGELDAVPSGQIAFSWKNGMTGRRQIMGFSGKRDLYWHYGITPKPRAFPFPHVRLVSRVIFTEDGHTPIGDPKRMHRLRRSFTKSWRNAKWRDMMLAFLHWVADGKDTLAVPVGSETALLLALPPATFRAPMSIALEDDDEEDVEDDLSPNDEDVLDFNNLDGDEELVKIDGEDDRSGGGDLEGKDRAG